MTPQEQAQLNAAEQEYSKANPSKEDNAPGKVGTAVAGALSGATGGITGNWGPLADYSTRAQTANPMTYGAGYGAGTVATLPIGGALLKGAVKGAGTLATKGRAAIEAGADIGSDLSKKAFPKLSEWMSQQGGREAAVNAYKAGEVRPAIQIPEKIQNVLTSKPTQTVLQTGTRGATLSTGPEPQVPTPPAPAAGAPQSTEPQKTSSAEPSFGTLADWLTVAKNNTNNPAVQAEADKSLAAMQQAQDPGANRLLAMNLQKTPQGRAVGNEDSPVNQTDEDEEPKTA